MNKKTIIQSLLLLLLVACENETINSTQFPVTNMGKKVFSENCARCHGDQGQGLGDDWKKPLANGKYPAPPLNGIAHTWHHPPKLLLQTINNGGAKVGGWMPPFKDKLSETEKLLVLEHIFSLWPAEIRDKYSKMFK